MTATVAILLRRMFRPTTTAAILAVNGLFLALGLLVRNGDVAPLLRGLSFVEDLGLALLVPLAALMAAHLALGRWVDERTAILLWARPVARHRLALATWLASLALVLPAAVLPVAVAAAATGVPGLLGGALAGGLAAAGAYTALFAWTSTAGRQALLWGVGYVLIWEGFVARASDAAGWLSIRAHGAALLGDRMAVTLDGTASTAAAAALVLAAATAGPVVLLSLRMSRRAPT